MKKIVAILCSRMSSERLAGKALVEIAGKPSLIWIIERLRMSAMLTDIIVATTEEKADDPICQAAIRAGMKVHRGQRDDVAARMQGAIDRYAHDADYIFRAMGDQPFLDWRSLDEACRLLLANPGWDFLLPLAFGEEPVYGASLSPWSRRVWAAISSGSTGEEREHPGMWLRRNLPRFDYAMLDMPHWSFRPYRLELDCAADLGLIRTLYEAWQKEPKSEGPPPMRWVISHLDAHQELAALNASIVERTGTFVSFTQDEIDTWQRDFSHRPIVWSETAGLVGQIMSAKHPYICEQCGGALLACGIRRGDLVMACSRCGAKRTFYAAKPPRNMV